MKTLQKLHTKQSGIAAFIVVFMLMIVITLIVAGYTQIVRRNQRQVLDRNLSSRAFYAAESGVNMATQLLKTNPGAYPAGKTNCPEDGTFTGGGFDYTIDAAAGLEITCLTINNTPASVDYSNVANMTSQVVPILGSGAINNIKFSWQATTPPGAYTCVGSASPVLPPGAGAGWTCGAPMLRVDLVRVGAGLTMASLPNNTYSFFLYPAGVGGSASSVFTTAAGSQGNVLSATCSAAATPRHCNFTITGLGASQYFYARVYGLYGDTNLSVSATNGAGTVNLIGTQAVIDVTGRAQDVSRRIQVRRPIQGASIVPDFALQGADGLCKRLLVAPGVDAALDPSDGSITDSSNPCGL